VWVRQVQLRLLTRYKDRSAKSLHGLDALLFDSLRQIDMMANQVLAAEKVSYYKYVLFYLFFLYIGYSPIKKNNIRHQ
jgi:hypothetical protein